MDTHLDLAQEIDVRDLIPVQRHERLLKIFETLPANRSFTFINDHDPLPLYYEFRSIHGDVVGWEYLNKGGRTWKVKVTRTKDSASKVCKDVSTLIDLRKVDEKDWNYVVLHRYGMMEEGDTMELVAALNLKSIHGIFVQKFDGKHTWIYKKNNHREHVVHITKKAAIGLGDDPYTVVNEFDVRLFTPTERHKIFYKAFADLKPGEAFIFINDHDPKPLYYQMEAESKVSFKWEYLERGQDNWKVRVIKTIV